MKKIVLVVLFVLIALFAGYVALKVLNKPVIYSSLSERAKEYIKSKSKTNDSWSGIGVDKQENDQTIVETSKQLATECFSYKVPFTVLKVKNDGVCNIYTTFESPRGELTVHQETAEVSLDENPSIMMRRSKQELYRESKQVLNGHTYLIFQNTDSVNNHTAFTQSNGKLTIVNMLAYTDENLDDKFLSLLNSLKITP